jgi:hypothetical protein
MTQFRMIPVFALCCLGFLLLMESGCVSGRTLTTLKPVSEPELRVPDCRFYIADLQYTTVPNAYNGNRQEDRLAKQFKKECSIAYPNLFTTDQAGSVSLGIDVVQKDKVYIGKTMIWMYGTLMISGLILPCPGQADAEYDIRISVLEDESAVSGKLCATNGFKNEYHTWSSLFTPAALIEIPGESDFPKISGSLFNMKPLEDDYYNVISRQLAAAVAHAVVGAGPEFTKAAPSSAPVIAQTKLPVVEKTDNAPVDVPVPIPVAVLPAPAQPPPVQTTGSPLPVPTVKTPVADISTQLKKLDELKSLGLITEDEYEARKADLTGKL